MNKGDTYIILCFVWGTVFVGFVLYAAYDGWNTLPNGLFTFATALVAGEVLGLSAYKAFTYRQKNKRNLEAERPERGDETKN